MDINDIPRDRDTLDRLAAVVLQNFEKLGLSHEDAEREAMSFAYAAAEILYDRMADVAYGR